MAKMVKFSELYTQFPPVPGGWGLATPKRVDGKVVGEYIHPFGGKAPPPPKKVENRLNVPNRTMKGFPPEKGEEKIEKLRQFYAAAQPLNEKFGIDKSPFWGDTEDDAAAVLHLPEKSLQKLFGLAPLED